MTKREILMDWLSKKENRDKLSFADLNEESIEAYETYGDVFKYPEGSNVIRLHKTYFRLKPKKENDIHTAY